MRALIVGRFQPLHKGHLKAIAEVLSKCEELVVVIGSAEESHTARNPLTAGERYQMLIASIPANEHGRIHIVPVRDVNRYSIWVNHIESYVPPFDIVFSNSPITRSLFSQVGYDVSETTAFNAELYNGTEIRRRMADGERWRHLVPKPVALMLDEIGIKERLLNAEGRTGSRSRPRRSRARK